MLHRLHDLLVTWGPSGLFAAALLESLGMPNPGGTDALMLLVTIARPQDAWLCAGLAILGTLLGSIVFHSVVTKGGEKFLAQQTSTPRGAKLHAWFERYGLASVFVCALVPIPFLPLKVMQFCACGLGVSRARFMAVIMAARIPRYIGLAYLGQQLGENSSAWLKEHVWHLAIFAILLSAALFLLLRVSERRPASVTGS